MKDGSKYFKKLLINKENSTGCVKLMRKQHNIISLPRDDELIIDFGGLKRNQIQQYFILVQ